jgi:hypothetical protein
MHTTYLTYSFSNLTIFSPKLLSPMDSFSKLFLKLFWEYIHCTGSELIVTNQISLYCTLLRSPPSSLFLNLLWKLFYL